jgi:hypothetical protein
LLNARKLVGQTDQAIECRLAGGIVMHFFTGDPGRSCNNLGTIVPRITATPPNCRMVCRSGTVTTDESLVLPSFVYRTSCGCYVQVPGLTLFGGNAIQSQTCTYVCDE